MKRKPISFSLTPMMEEEMEALIESGEYSSKSDIIRDAFRVFLENKADKKIIIALELYRKEKISLTRGAELAGLDIESFKEVLRDRGIKLRTYSGSKEELEEGLDNYDNLGYGSGQCFGQRWWAWSNLETL